MVSVILDSSNIDLLVALAKDDKVIDSICYEAWQQQSELMVVELKKILKRNNISREDISEVLCGIGPGSYTGVRISLTIAKTMSFALNVPVYPISSLRMLKNGKKASICVINARSKRSYVGVYKDDEIIINDTIWTNEALLKYISEHPDYCLCGDTSYLGLEGYISNKAIEMMDLKKATEPMLDTLGLKPVYLKD
jgi:tRNA threonylcarbamoyl adenosine modification protein YeaZ